MNTNHHTNPNIFSFSAVIAAVFFTGDYDDNELNALGNWVILFGQYILTYAAQMQLIESSIDRHNINVNSKQYKNGGSPYSNGKSNQNQRMEVDYILEILDKLQKEINELKKKDI